MRAFTVNPIVNISRTEIVTEESTPRVLTFATIGSATPEPVVSKGDEKELRIRNQIIAQSLLEDIIKGYDIKLTDAAMSRELLELLDGGDGSEGGSYSLGGYTSPAAGSVSARTRFTLNIYVSEKDYGGSEVSYFRFSFPGCVGTPASFSFEDGAFVSPEYTVRSRPASGQSAMTVICIDKMPVYAASAADMPASPVNGQSMVVTSGFTVSTTEYEAGQFYYYNGVGWQRL